MLKLLPISAALALAMLAVLHLLFPLPDRIEYTTVISGKNGEPVHAFLTSDGKWRMDATLAEISPLLRTTIIHKEDRFFYHHFGVNPVSMVRAFARNLIRGKRTSGASTITMQVARALEHRPRNYANKIAEIFRAFQIELKYNKEEILALYVNLLPYGGNIEGVKAASLLYFGKDPDHLSLAEITALCIIPNRPSSLVPGRHNARIREERNRWLRIFEKRQVFTARQIADALTEPFEASRRQMPRHVPHLARRLKHTGATRVQTHIDLHLQGQTEKIVGQYVQTLYRKNIRNAAVVMLDNPTGRVITYIGSADFHDSTDGGQVDGAAAVRQPGSTLKPLLYGMCIDEGMMTPKSLVADIGTNFNGYAPENFDRKFNGYVSMEHALEHSLNVPAVRALNQLGTDRFLQTLAQCGFETVKKDQRKLGLSLVLGGCGASLLELTALYASFANEGVYKPPVLAGVSMKGSNKNETNVNIYAKNEKGRGPTGHTVMSPAAAFMINETLSKIGRPDFPLSWQSTEHMPRISWKTGTSYGRRDAWSIGYNKRYTVGVWVGNFSGAGVPELSGAEIATPLLFRIFNMLDYDSDREWFGQPTDCDTRIVCAETGMPPAGHCTGLVSDYFIPLVSSTRSCDNKEEVLLAADGRMSFCAACLPPSGYRKALFSKIPAEMQLHFDEHHLAYEKIPPHNPRCEKIFRDARPMIVSPRGGSEYLISRHDPEPLQLRCRAGNDAGLVYWYINDQFYKTGNPAAPLFFLPDEGPVKISCSDDKGRNRDIWIRVRYLDL